MFNYDSTSLNLLRISVSDNNLRENQNTHLCSMNFLPEKKALYEIMWKNTVQPDKLQKTIWRMRIASWIPEATHTHTHTQNM